MTRYEKEDHTIIEKIRNTKKDIYIDYSFEGVMFRRMHTTKLIFRKLYGEKEFGEPVSYDNNLYNNSILLGGEITKEEYEVGKPIDQGILSKS
jgi:hypothetical protein